MVQVFAIHTKCPDEIVYTTSEPHSKNGTAQHKRSHGSFA